jgi:hypothetical protein
MTDGPGNDFDAWAASAQELLDRASPVLWALGDWMAHGAQRWPTRYLTVVSTIGLHRTTVAHLTFVSVEFPPWRRNLGVSWAHHHAATQLPADDRPAQLQRAADEQLTAGEFVRCAEA